MMAKTGELEKMLILAFESSDDAERHGKEKAKAKFEAFINPETYTIEQKLKFSIEQGHGTSGKQLKYEYSQPEEMTFEFLFDCTGIIDGEQRSDITKKLAEFKQVLTGYDGGAHEPRHFKLVWGTSLFKGRVTEMSITYKLFKADGTPLRAVAKVKFKSSIEDLIRAAKENKTSPDLTHTRKVKGGDTLDLMCFQIYRDPNNYLQVARENGINNFRSLKEGTNISFPPLEKTSTAT
jgi:hypothetical protein